MPNDDSDEKILWDYLNLKEKIEKSDCILGLGSQDRRVAIYCSELFLAGFAPLIIFSGGIGRLTDRSWGKTESEEFLKISISLGVPKEKIIIENKSTNTKENILFTKKVIINKNLKLKKIIVVTQPFLERRAKEVFKKFLPNKNSFFSYLDIDFESFINTQISKDDLINMMVGEVQRLITYSSKGYLPYQGISDKVKEATKRLIKRGYTKYLI